MKEVCDIVAERIALGEPLGDAAEHAASCPRCRRLSALPTELGATHNESDPGIGFAARMTAGAQHRITVRRRRRVAATLAATVAATVLGIVFLTRQPTEPVVAPAPPVAADTHQHDKPAEVDADVEYLVHLARTDRASHTSAKWRRIEKPLAPYKHLVKGMTP
jgi:hypothetical protein